MAESQRARGALTPESMLRPDLQSDLSLLRTGARQAHRPRRTAKQSIACVSLVVPDHEEAIAFYVGVLGFELVRDTFNPEENKRLVVVAPRGSPGCKLLLAQAAERNGSSSIGNQAGERVHLCLHTDNFDRDYTMFMVRGVKFLQQPQRQPYGTVAVFGDPWGNLWELVQPKYARGA